MTITKGTKIYIGLSVVIVYLLVNIIYMRLHPTVVSYIDVPTIDTPQVWFKGKSYFVKLEKKGDKEDVWLREGVDYAKASDIYAMSISLSGTTMKEAAKNICKEKREYDNGKMIVGCLQTAGVAACAFTTAATEGAAAVMCTEAWEYSFETGLGACLAGVADKIAEQLELTKEWDAIQTQYHINSGQATEAVEASIALACAVGEHADEDENPPVPATSEPNSGPGKTATPSTGPAPTAAPTAPFNPNGHPDRGPGVQDHGNAPDNRPADNHPAENHPDGDRHAPDPFGHLDGVPGGAGDNHNDHGNDNDDKGGDMHIDRPTLGLIESSPTHESKLKRYLKSLPFMKQPFFGGHALVKDSATAIAVCMAVLKGHFGKKEITRQAPYQLNKINNFWSFNGSGTNHFLVVINALDGRIVSLKTLSGEP